MRGFVVAVAVVAAAAGARAEETAAPSDGGVVRVRLIPDTSAVVREHAVPWQPKHHTAGWTTGAIITVTSIGVTALGAGLTLLGMSNGGLGNCDVTEHPCAADPAGAALFGVGIAVSMAGDIGLLIAGPATWIAGTKRPPED